ncbi:MAG: 6,7-dimethyl-8-ribityllumazine synthase [Desulfurococcales archaeon]|jgi:6,7-dimethyl-8-ribityllumazine synthase|nr:6,7-dimethyl-8-ribityllumazine synthase [Desulfurococcales archaeon]
MSARSGSEECGKKDIGLAIVVSEFNYDITSIMLSKAEDHAKFLGVSVKIVARAPGSYDIPILVKKILEKGGIDAVVTLGAVIEGETEHDEVVAHQAARKILDLSIEYGKPVTLGIIGPGATRLQALERAEEYARRAVEAAVKLVKRVREISCKAET